MIPILDVLRQETICHGRINGRSFELRGGGLGRPFDGIVHTDLKSTTGPLHFPPTLLSPVLIMGYPTFSTYHQGAFDLFKLSDGYTYERSFSFQNKGHMHTRHSVTYHGDHLKGNFEVVDAEIDLPEICHGEPTIETFIPMGAGQIDSRFVMAWRLPEGGLFRSSVESSYKLTHNAALPYLQFRYITFDTKVDSEHVSQTEKLHVFRDLKRINQAMI